MNVLQKAQQATDGVSHKLVQPGDTRWQSYDGSVDILVRHYGVRAICVALESIYVGATYLSCDAGGLLLTLRKDSTLFILLKCISELFQTTISFT